MIAGASAFDPPPGSGYEHDEELPFLIDGNPATAWTTERYGSRRFGNLKDGVGVVLRLDRAYRLSKLQLTSPTAGWSAQIFTAAEPKADLAGWGQAVAAGTVTGGSASFDLHGARAQAVLIWIPDLGEGNAAVGIGDVQLHS